MLLPDCSIITEPNFSDERMPQLETDIMDNQQLVADLVEDLHDARSYLKWALSEIEDGPIKNEILKKYGWDNRKENT